MERQAEEEMEKGFVVSMSWREVSKGSWVTSIWGVGWPKELDESIPSSNWTSFLFALSKDGIQLTTFDVRKPTKYHRIKRTVKKSDFQKKFLKQMSR